MQSRFCVVPRTSTPQMLCCGALLMLSAACSPKGAAPVVAPLPAPSSTAEALPALEGTSGPMGARQAPRRVGDVWVHRFSGSYRKSAVILREEVIAKKGELLIVDFILDEEGHETHLRVDMAARSERIVSVSVVFEDEIIPGEIADFEAMLAKTLFVPDQNQGRRAEKSQTCLVGKQELACELSEYEVRLGDEAGTLKVARNAEIQRDISGEITTVDGTVLYHAELIEMQRGEALPSLPTQDVALLAPNPYDGPR